MELLIASLSICLLNKQIIQSQNAIKDEIKLFFSTYYLFTNIMQGY